MRRGKHFVTILLCLVFLAGIIAPVPECYVTRVVCPLKKRLALAAGLTNAPLPSLISQCCARAGHPQAAENSPCPLESLKSRMKPYAPAFEMAEAPILPLALLPVLSFKPVSRNTAVFLFAGGKRPDMPDPIPILQRKQSFLI